MIVSEMKHSHTVAKHIFFILLISAHVLFGWYALPDYIPWRSVNFIVAVAGLPFIIYKSVAPVQSYRFIILALAAAVVAVFLPVNTFVFIALVASALGAIECVYGKISVIPLFIILIISPAFYVINIFSFPIRMQLTGVAGSMFNFAGLPTTVAGNVINYNGNEYTVDPACMGLKMLMTSLWFGMYMIFFIQKKYNRYLSIAWLICCLGVIFFLNIVTNLVRIILLVYFDILPANILHGLIGLACFAIYTVVPAVFIFKWLIKQFGKVKKETAENSNSIRVIYKMSVLSAVTIAILAFSIQRNTNIPTSKIAQPVNGYTVSMFSKNVIQLKSPSSIIYIKDIAGFYAAEHNPLMCWIGSGYEFEDLGEKEINGITIYTGTLRNKGDMLYTAWWYDNGEHRTISQLKWRWDTLSGKKSYSVINVTCNSPQDLDKELRLIFEKNIINKLL